MSVEAISSCVCSRVASPRSQRLVAARLVGPLDVEGLLADLAKVADRKAMKAARKGVKEGRQEEQHEGVRPPRSGGRRLGACWIISDPPLLVPARELVSDDQAQELEERTLELLGRYRESLKGDRRHLLDSYRFVEMARKVVGVGSVGTRAWVVPTMGLRRPGPALPAGQGGRGLGVEPDLGASEFENHGERVVEGQWLMQAASDILLGWLPALGLDGEQSRL